MSTRERLQAVAAAFLARDIPPRIIVVAGEANGRLAPAPVAEGLREAGRALDVRVADVGAASLPREPPHVLLLELGPLDVSSLSRLSPPVDPGPDLLLWTLPVHGGVSVRSRYILGLWAWSLSADRVRCLTSGCEDLQGTEDVVRNGLQVAGFAGPCEVLDSASDLEEGGALYQQILQSLLSAPPRAARARA